MHETNTFTQIMLRFPDGKRLQRRFNGDAATTDDVYRWAEAEGDIVSAIMSLTM